MKRTLTTLVAAAALVLVPLGAAETSYSDPAGDAGSGPDITTVIVSNTETGVVTVRIAVPLEPSSVVAVAIDADRNASTGNEFGLEGAILVIRGSGLADLEAVAVDEDGDELPAVLVSSTYVSGVLEFSFPREAFSIDQGFAFGFIAGRLDADWELVFGDVAPADPCWEVNVRCSQLWVYELVGVTPLPPPAPVVKPVLGKPVATPKKPIAGRRFTVRVPVTRSDNDEPLRGAVITCRTSIGDKLVRHRQTFRSGTLTVTLTVPKGTKGKRLSIVVMAASKANSQTTDRTPVVKTFKYRIT